jgi:hypothetical protein
MVGVSEKSKSLRIPFPKEEQQDVTKQVAALLETYPEELIALGRKAHKKSETAYAECRVAVEGKVGLWTINATDPLDPSRPYVDGFEVVVVHRIHYKSLSIYCAPGSEFAFGGQEVGGIQFAGHPKAAGSPRGVEFNLDDAKRVYSAVIVELSQ